MKEFRFNMTKQLLEKAKKPIRNKITLIMILLETIQQIIIGYEPRKDYKGKFILRVEKMSRIVYVLEGKIFSYSFPFLVYEKENQIKIKESYSGIIINNEHLSYLKRIYKLGFVEDSRTNSFEHDISELMDELSLSSIIDEIWYILKVLQTFEPGYLRYDYDPENENGKIHPLHHIDIFYTDKNTFKLGVDNEVSPKMFFEILDIGQECYYINKKLDIL